jgi:hypothetical protein
MCERLLINRQNKRGKPFRTVACMRVIAPKWYTTPAGDRYAMARDSVDVMVAPGRRTASFRNLAICGSCWLCPVCASRISEQKVKLLEQVAHNPDYATILVTLTLKHEHGERLEVLQKALLDSFNACIESRAWHNRDVLGAGEFPGIKIALGIAGFFRGYEITEGAYGNGWHPHLHVLLVLRRDGRADDEITRDAVIIEDWFKDNWIGKLRKQGRFADAEHGVKVDTTYDRIAEYISKYGKMPDLAHFWTVEREVAKAVSKQSRKHGRTIWQIVIDSFMAVDGQGRPDMRKRQRSQTLFFEYAVATFGKHQLEPSKDLRAEFDLKVLADEALAATLAEDMTLFTTLNWEQWAVILKSDRRAELLEVAVSGNKARFDEWLASVPDMPVRALLDNQACMPVGGVTKRALADESELASVLADNLKALCEPL